MTQNDNAMINNDELTHWRRDDLYKLKQSYSLSEVDVSPLLSRLSARLSAREGRPDVIASRLVSSRLVLPLVSRRRDNSSFCL